MIHDHPIESIGSWSFSVKNVKMGFSLGVEIPPRLGLRDSTSHRKHTKLPSHTADKKVVEAKAYQAPWLSATSHAAA